jgi:hypothetical protein
MIDLTPKGLGHCADDLHKRRKLKGQLISEGFRNLPVGELGPEICSLLIDLDFGGKSARIVSGVETER